MSDTTEVNASLSMLLFTTPPSPLSPLSSLLPQIPSPPLPLRTPPTTHSPTHTHTQGVVRRHDGSSEEVGSDSVRVASPSTHHPSEIPSPPLLLPYTTRRDDLPEADIPLQKRARFTAPTGRFDVGESSSAAVARHARHILAHTVDYGFIDTIMQISMLLKVECNHHGGGQERVIESFYYLETGAQELYIKMQRIRDEDKLTAYIQHEHDRFRELIRTLKAGPQDGPEDAGSSC
ncbi:hypothetical protein Tco_0471892 [Tanacetum coccineum]